MCLAATADHVADRVGQTRQTMRQARTARKKYHRQSTQCGWPAHFEYSEAGKPGLPTPCCRCAAANAMLPMRCCQRHAADALRVHGCYGAGRCTTEGTASTGLDDTKTEARKLTNARAGGDTPQIFSVRLLPARSATRTRSTPLSAPANVTAAKMHSSGSCTTKNPAGARVRLTRACFPARRGKITSS